MIMASCGITIAKRTNASLLRRFAGNGQLSSKPAASLFGCRSIHNGHGSQLFARATAAKTSSIPPSSTPSHSNNSPANSTFVPLGSTIRAFGRKGSRMGHHIQNIDEMAHTDSHEEAKGRREDKKKNSKKARMESKGAASDTNSDEDDTSGGGSDGDFGPKEDEFGNPLLPEPSAVRSNMLTVLAYVERSFSSMRGGETSAELFDSVRVSAYGETVPLSSVGQVVIEDQQRATISCYDPSVASDVRDAVRDMPGMNLNPYVEEGGSGVVIIPIPRASEETRREMVKELGRQAENGRQRVRNIRRKAMDSIKKGKDGKMDGISKDDAFRVGKDVDSVTEEVLTILKEMVEKKQKSVMDD